MLRNAHRLSLLILTVIVTYGFHNVSLAHVPCSGGSCISFDADTEPTFSGEITWNGGSGTGNSVTVNEGQSITFSVSAPTDNDKHTVDCPETGTETHNHSDSASINWEADAGMGGAGSPATGTGNSFTWTAPDDLDPGECTRTVTITATATDGGGGDDCTSGTTGEGEGKSDTVTVTVRKVSCETATVTATAGAWSPATTAVGTLQTSDLSASATVDCVCEDEDPTWSWEITSVKKDGNVVTGPWTYLSIDHPDNTSSTATLKADTFPCGEWEVGVKATYNWKSTGCSGGCEKESAEKFTGTATAVGVDRIIVQGSSPEDTGPATALVGETVDLEAKPCPDGASFPSGNPVWTLQSKPAASTLSSSLGTGTTKSVEPDVVGTYVVKATCGSSSDTFTIKAIEASLIIYADQPGVGGDRDMLEDEDCGHTFWEPVVSDESVLPTALKTYANRKSGFYPENGVDPVPPGVDLDDDGELRDDSTHGWDVKKEYTLDSYEDLISLLEFTKDQNDSPSTYHLENFNCTDCGIAAGAAAGVTVPDTSQTYSIPLIATYTMSNPGDLGEDLMAAGGTRNPAGSSEDNGSSKWK